MTAQAAYQTGTRDRRIDELTGDRHQVVSWQQERRAQFHHDELFHRRERRVQRERTMRAVGRTVAVLLANRLSRDIVEPGKFSLGQRGGSNFLAYQMGCTSLAVQGLCHEIGGQLSLMNSVRKTRLALKSGQLRMGT